MKIIRYIVGFPTALIVLMFIIFPCFLFWGTNGMDRIEKVLDFWYDFMEGN